MNLVGWSISRLDFKLSLDSGDWKLYFALKFRNFKQLSIHRVTAIKVKRSKISEGADTEVPDPDSLGGGQGVTGGDGENVTGGGEIPDPGGDSDIEGVKLTGRQVRDFRVVRQSESKNVISIFFTPVTSGKFRLSVYRSGETEKEPIKLRPVGEKEWVTSIELKALNLKNRILIKTEIHPEDFDFALEGVMINAN